MATVTPGVDLATLTALIKRMYPHESFPDGPYTRSAEAIAAAAAEDPRSRAQLEQGLHLLDADGFTDLDADAAHAYLEKISGSAFFQQVRGEVITSLYNDPEVWEILGWKTDSFSHGGYMENFDDLDWLPEARVEGPPS